MYSITMSSQKILEFRDFVKSSMFSKYVAIVFGEESFYGMVIDEGVVPVASLFEIPERHVDENLVVYVPIKIMSTIANSASSVLMFDVSEDNIRVDIDGTSINITPVDVANDEKIDLTSIVELKNNIENFGSSHQVGEALHDAIKETKIGDKSFVGAKYAVSKFDQGDLHSGSSSYFTIVNGAVPNDVSVEFHTVFLPRLQLISSEQSILRYDENGIMVSRGSLHFISDISSVNVGIPDVKSVMSSQEVIIDAVAEYDQILSYLDHLSKLYIVIMDKKDKLVDVSFDDNSIKFFVYDKSNKMSNASDSITINEAKQYRTVTVEFGVFQEFLKHVDKEESLRIKILENGVYMKKGSTEGFLTVFM